MQAIFQAMGLDAGIDGTKLPQHIAIIMDGNGRWAKAQGKPRVYGHRQGVTAVREVTEAAAGLGIPYLTLYAFSAENWRRPVLEVSALMQLLVQTIRREMKTLQQNQIRLHAIGDLSVLPGRTRQSLEEAMAATALNHRMTLTLALNYGSRQEIVQAFRELGHAIKEGRIMPDEIDQAHISKALYTREMPDPELVIRTSGEQRISNFLLWQVAYAELLFSPVMWPDFRKEHLYQAIIDYQHRERRFGKTTEQLITHDA